MWADILLLINCVGNMRVRSEGTPAHFPSNLNKNIACFGGIDKKLLMISIKNRGVVDFLDFS